MMKSEAISVINKLLHNDVREKLTHILTSDPEMLKNLNVSTIKFYRLVDKLIANGVTVQEFGEWEEIEDDWNTETIYKCSACKEEFVTIDGTPADNLWNYCPHCGAKMMPQPPKGD